MTGIEEIIAEREQQIVKHNRTVQYDLESNDKNQLILGASSLLHSDSNLEFLRTVLSTPKGWSNDIFVHMMNKNRRQRLIIAGALIAAEIDRLDLEKLKQDSK